LWNCRPLANHPRPALAIANAGFVQDHEQERAMGRRHQRAVRHLANAQDHARRLSQEFHRLLEMVPDAHDTWSDLASDAVAIERVLMCAEGSIKQVFRHDVFAMHEHAAPSGEVLLAAVSASSDNRRDP
jgi:hypothetical protein